VTLAMLMALLLGGVSMDACALEAPESFSDIAERLSPVVVNIRTEKLIHGGGRVLRHFDRNPFGDDDMLDFFERFFGGDSNSDSKQQSLGSGFIIDPDGLIVTNNHVIEGADEIRVVLETGKTYDADIVGRDTNTDLALIRVKADRPLPAAELGDSDALKIGQWVVAIGNPFGLEHTVTAGIVSAKGRVIGSGPYDDFIQTDASINPGNSGGPLIDMQGKVIGINTAIIASGQGIGFAVPMNMARGVISQLKKSGEVVRGWIGVAIQDITEEIADYYGIKEGGGVLVTEAFDADPAAKAGVRAGDIIVAVDGKPVAETRDLTRTIADIPVGNKARVTVSREGKEQDFLITIAKRDDTRTTTPETTESDPDAIGIEVSEITTEMAKRFNMPKTGGVIVTEVTEGSKGEKAGIMHGDIIREVNRQVIETPDDYHKAIDAVEKGGTINLFIRRINRGFVLIKLEK